ncbi:MAG: hypothetical protein Kow0047_05650 [Anaerolineae bacterium]
MNATSGSFSLNVPGTPVVAYLYWAGYDHEAAGDNQVSLAVDGGAATMINAQKTFGPDLWLLDNGVRPNLFHWVFRADVTNLVQQGTHSYTVSDFSPKNAYGVNYGAGLLVVYEDANLPNGPIQILEGLDSAYWNFPAPRGPDTDVSCLTFDSATFHRDMQITTFAGGVEGTNRPNNLWILTGSGTPPSEVIGAAGTTKITQPFFESDGEQWDTFGTEVEVSPGDTWVCMQVESVSPDDTGLPDTNGSSLLWLAAGGVFLTGQPTAVTLSGLSASSGGASLVWLFLIPAVVLLLALWRRR